MGDWFPWACFAAFALASTIEGRRHGRYMYRLALRHVEEEAIRNDVFRSEGGVCWETVKDITHRLRAEVGRG